MLGFFDLYSLSFLPPATFAAQLFGFDQANLELCLGSSSPFLVLDGMLDCRESGLRPGADSSVGDCAPAGPDFCSEELRLRSPTGRKFLEGGGALVDGELADGALELGEVADTCCCCCCCCLASIEGGI